MNQPDFLEPSAQPGPPVYELSGWWRRVGAAMIDGFIVYFSAIIFMEVTGVGDGFSSTTSSNGANAALSFDGWGLLVYFVFSVLLATTVMAYTNGQTVGMMATGIRVLREDGERISFGFAFFRENIIKGVVFGWLAIFTLYIATILNYLWPLWDEKNQALHDKICKTRVVINNSAGTVHTYDQMPPAPAMPPTGPPPSLGPPPPPIPPGPQDTYQAPPGFENPVPDDK